jgi:hypothetical protein
MLVLIVVLIISTDSVQLIFMDDQLPAGYATTADKDGRCLQEESNEYEQ